MNTCSRIYMKMYETRNTKPGSINSLWPSDAIWQQIFFVNISSGNGLLPDSTKAEPMLSTY